MAEMCLKQSELKSPADQPLIKTEPTAYHKSHQSQQPMHYDISVRSALLDVLNELFSRSFGIFPTGFCSKLAYTEHMLTIFYHSNNILLLSIPPPCMN